MNAYVVMTLSNVDDAAEDWLSTHAFEFGALGLSEALHFDQPEGEEDVFTRHAERRTLQAFFDSAPSAELIEALRARHPEVTVAIQEQPNQDWLAEWKKGFKPFALTGGHWVVPSWCEPPPEAQHKIWIDPGMAFGTGTHETTRLVAEQLRQIVARQTVHGALDVGTGTGILAILARQLGVARLVATEIEADARRVAKENFALNACVDVVLDDTQVQDLTETFDVVMANIIDGVLVRLRNELIARVKPGGWFVASGIITEREPDFLRGFTLPAGKTWDVRAQAGDWLLYAVKL